MTRFWGAGRFLLHRAGLPAAAAASSAFVSQNFNPVENAESSPIGIRKRPIEKVYDLLDNKPVGMGGFGVVCPGRHSETGEVVAIKSVSKKHTSKVTPPPPYEERDDIRSDMRAPFFACFDFQRPHPALCKIREYDDVKSGPLCPHSRIFICLSVRRVLVHTLHEFMCTCAYLRTFRSA